MDEKFAKERFSLGEIIRFLRLIRPYWKHIAEAVLTGPMVTLLALPGPWLTKVLIDDVLYSGDKNLLVLVLALILGVTLFRSGLSALRSYFVLHLGLEMGLDIRFRFYKHLQRLSFKFYDSRETGEILSRFRDASEALRTTIGLFDKVVMSSLSLLVFPAVLVCIHWKLALLALAVFPLNALLFLKVSKVTRRYSKRIAEKGAEASAKNYESLSGIRTIQSLTIESKVLGRLKKLFLQLRDLQLRLGLVQQGSRLLTGALQAVGAFLYGWYGWAQILNGDLSLGTYIAFSLLIGHVYAPMTQIVDLIWDLQPTLVHINRFFEIYDIEPDVKDSPGALELARIRGEIEFQNVTFSYDGGPPVLKDINLKIRPGTVVGLVGRSGEGKTTLSSLIPRFYDPNEGRILVDGYDLRRLKLKCLREQIGLVFQEPFLFHGTIRENISCGRPGVSQEEVERAAKIANAHEFIVGLAQGYETQVGERGVRLSQGEKQRISLARVLVSDTPILILDEPVSSVDLESEHKIQEALEKVMRGRTTIVIAHRLSTIKGADTILVVDDGRIVERGKHEELMESRGAYYQLYKRTGVT